jgi:hypothetical protein
MSTGMESMATMRASILEDWMVWTVKHMSYLTPVRTQQALGLDIVPLRVAAMLGGTISRNLYSWRKKSKLQRCSRRLPRLLLKISRRSHQSPYRG